MPEHLRGARPAVLIVRHPLSEYNVRGVWAGWSDTPLAQQGWAQTARAADVWAERPPDRVVSSDLRRAADAAAAIADRLGVPHTIEPEWRERNAGEWQGRKVQDLADDPLYQHWALDQRACPPGGEPYKMFTGRITRQAGLLRGSGLQTLVVSHGGVLDALSDELGAFGRERWNPRPLLDALTIQGDGSARVWAADMGTLPSADGVPTCREATPPLGEAQTCYTCEVAADLGHGDVVWRSALSVMNHTGDEGLQGWFILSPVRHVTAARQLTSEERGELAEVASAADEVLAEKFGSRRTLIASLGWYTSDHLHIHLVPTFRPHVSYGSLNFDGAYVPWPGSRPQAVAMMRDNLPERLR